MVNKFLIALAIYLGFLVITALKSRYDNQKEAAPLVDMLKIEMEKSYFEGQKAALTGDVRIELDSTSGEWSWIKSPWNDGTHPKFKPSNNKQ